MWMRVTVVSHPSQTPALAAFRPRGALLRLWSRSAGQRRICQLLGVCPRRLAMLILSPVAPSVIWPCDLRRFPPDLPRRPTPVPRSSSARHISKTNSYPFSHCKIAPDICDYSKPLNCLFLLHLLGCDRLSFIFTATLHLLFLSGGLFMFVSVGRKPRLAGIHQCALS